VNAQQLLAHASAVEEAHENNPNIVLHRSLQLEKRKYKDKKVLLRRRIDVWHSGARGLTARRVYDDSGNLVAGEWSERGGSSTIYERGTRSNLREGNRSIPEVLDSPQDLWQYDLSAGSFEGLVGTAAQAQVDTQGIDYVIHYEPRDKSGRMLGAVLTVRETDFRAVGLELTMRESEVSGPLAAASIPVVYSITEASFEQRPALEVNPQVFQTDAELLALSLPTDEGNATVDLQIETTYLLDRVGATLGQEVTVTVGADHKLHVEGVAATESRRAQIFKALGPIRNNPAVVINLMTVGEAVQRERVKPSVVTETTSQAEHGTIPAFDELSRYFEAETAPDSSVDVRGRIWRFSEQVLEDSGEAMRHAWVLKRLATTISPTEISSLNGTTHNEYLCMVAAHAQEVGRRTGKLRLQLGPIIFPNAAAAGREGDESNTSPTDLAQAVQQLFAAASRNDAAIQSSFSVTTGQVTEGTVKVQEIQSSLLEAERLAKWVRHAANVNDCGPDLPRNQSVP
jgi:hypothetical protein